MDSWPQADPVIVRLAGHADIKALVDMWVELTDFHRQLDSYYTATVDAEAKMAEHFAEQVANSKAIVLVAELDGAAAGYLMADIASSPPVFKGPEYVLITDTCVSESVRRRGVGRAMVAKLLEVARERGFDRLDVGYAACNANSTEFWAKMSFKPFSIRATLDLA